MPARSASSFAHAVEHANRAAAVDQRLGAARAFRRDIGAAGLSGVVQQHDGAIGLVGDAGERFHHDIDGGIVVLVDLVRAFQRIDHQHVDLAPLDLGDEAGDQFLVDDDLTVAVVARDHAGPVAAAIDEQPADQVAGLELVEATGGGDPPLDLFLRVFQVPVPDAQRRARHVEQQRLACDHFQNLDDHQR